MATSNSKKPAKAPKFAPVIRIKRKGNDYVGRAAIFDKDGVEIIVIAPDDACLMRACSKILFTTEVNGKMAKTVRVSQE